MKIGIISLFPEIFQALDYGITGRALANELVTLRHWSPRDFTTDRHRTVDDRPYGGGPGMVMMAEPLENAITAAKTELGNHTPVYFLSPEGTPLNHERIAELAAKPQMILLCGRYEGIDTRVVDRCVDACYSLGDYVLSGGEYAALVLVDAITRLLPGALGHDESAQADSFVDGLLDHPHYTRPEQYAGDNVPAVLLSGDHQAIARWRLKQALGRTHEKRPDLLAKLDLTKEQQQLLDEYITGRKEHE